MKILCIHNHYQQRGGEDAVFAAETTLLQQHGHEVLKYIEDNRCINEMERLTVAAQTIWSFSSKRRLLKILQNTRPDMVHFHNTFPLISPSAYYACREAGVPVVQSLHNPRLLCPAATFFRSGHVCEDCLGKTPPWLGVLHACYRNSHLQTVLVAMMLTVHRLFKTWEKQVDIYIVFTEFYRQKFIKGGLPSEKIVVKPHFVYPDPGLRKQSSGNYALFIGRLDPEKGVLTLLQAWGQVKSIPLKIRGNGRLLKEVQDFINKNRLKSVELVGRISKQELINLIKGARFLVWSSEGYYETFGLVAIEAFACGVPVITSHLGAMAEIVEDGRTGLHFISGDPKDLAAKVEWAWMHPECMQAMAREARAEYVVKYTAEQNYQMLMDIYQMTIEQHKRFK